MSEACNDRLPYSLKSWLNTWLVMVALLPLWHLALTKCIPTKTFHFRKKSLEKVVLYCQSSRRFDVGYPRKNTTRPIIDTEGT